MSNGSRQTVAVLCLEQVVAFDMAIPWQVLRDEHDVVHCGLRAGPVASTSGAAVVVDAGLEALEEADLVLVPGFQARGTPPEAAAALRDAHGRGARVGSICTGAFALAAAGLLDGRRATTHWEWADLLARRWPAVEVDPDVLWVDEGDVLTSAGVAAGIDLCLHLLRESHGAEAANAAARRMVVAPVRDGGQAQFVPRAAGDDAGGSLAATRAWALERLDQPLTVAELAAHAGWSERSFHRRWVAETGVPPLRWLHAQRVAEARRLLEATDLPVEEVARRCGFGTAVSLRAHFRRATRLTPTAYRRGWLSAAGQG